MAIEELFQSVVEQKLQDMIDKPCNYSLIFDMYFEFASAESYSLSVSIFC